MPLTGVHGRTLSVHCANTNRAYSPPSSARCRTHRRTAHLPAREQRNKLPASCAQKASQRQPGRDCRRKMQRHQRHAQHDLLQVQDRAGNARHQKPSTSARSRCSSTTSTLRLERCCCHRLAMQRAAPSRPSQRAPTHECRTRSTESCSSADSACHSHSPQSAVPAVDAWMSTATIARLARKWAC